LSVGPERVGKGSHELAERGLGLRCYGCGRSDEKEQSLGLRRAEAAEVGPGTAQQRPPPSSSRLRVHRDAGDGERLEIATCGGDGHLELTGELPRGYATTSLQHQEGRDETIRTHRCILPDNVLIP
jgi:hypothetical protein